MFPNVVSSVQTDNILATSHLDNMFPKMLRKMLSVCTGFKTDSQGQGLDCVHIGN